MKLANIAKLAIAGVGLSTLALSNSVFAEIQFGTKTTGSGAGSNSTGVQQGLVGTGDLVGTIQGMVNYLLGFCAIVAVLYGVYGGFLYLTSGGNDEQTKKAKTIFKQVAIGMLIIFLSYSVVEFLQSILNSSASEVTTS